MTPNSQPVNRTGRQHAHLHLQQQAAASEDPATHAADPVRRWKQLLVEEQQLQPLEQIMTVQNIRWCTDAWQLLHDRSERLCREMAACLQQLEGR